MDFEVPEDFVGQEVVLIENLPMQQKNGQIGYPSIRGLLLKVLKGSVLIQADGGQMVVPTHVLRGVNLVSAIQVVKSPLIVP